MMIKYILRWWNNINIKIFSLWNVLRSEDKELQSNQITIYHNYKSSKLLSCEVFVCGSNSAIKWSVQQSKSMLVNLTIIMSRLWHSRSGTVLLRTSSSVIPLKRSLFFLEIKLSEDVASCLMWDWASLSESTLSTDLQTKYQNLKTWPQSNKILIILEWNHPGFIVVFY